MKPPGPTVLIVNDEDMNAELVRLALKNAPLDYDIQSVMNGEEAVAYLTGTGRFGDRAAHPFPSLLLTDQKMPRMSGMELLEWMQAHAAHRVVPTIVMTTSGSQADAARAFQLGAQGYFVWPLAFAELERMLKLILEYWRLSLAPARDPSD